MIDPLFVLGVTLTARGWPWKPWGPYRRTMPESVVARHKRLREMAYNQGLWLGRSWSGYQRCGWDLYDYADWDTGIDAEMKRTSIGLELTLDEVENLLAEEALDFFRTMIGGGHGAQTV